MTILAVPNVVVRKVVDVDLQLAIGIHIHIHVRNEEYCAMNRHYHHPPNHDRLNLIRDIEVHQSHVPILVIF